ncbi:response regulator [Cupriavidus necator]
MSESSVTSALPMILFVDDEATAVKYFERAIGALAPVVTAGSVDEGKAMLDRHADSLAVLVSDQRMPGESGNELLRYAREHFPHVVRILTTAYSEIDMTVEAVNVGHIHRYIKKPWDIAALRMELKQALEYSSLKKERDVLLQEKLAVAKKQVGALRIGTIRTLCASLLGPDCFQPVETYLFGVDLAGVTLLEPDWTRMDYVDLVSAESYRSGAFSHAVSARLTELRGIHLLPSSTDVMAIVAQVIGDAVRQEDNYLTWQTPAVLSEFIEQPLGTGVSVDHVNWLAVLLWLEGYGMTLQFRCEDAKVISVLGQRTQRFPEQRVAAWIDRISEAR